MLKLSLTEDEILGILSTQQLPNNLKFQQEEIVPVISPTKEVLYFKNHNNNFIEVTDEINNTKVWTLTPYDKEQAVCINYLLNPLIRLVNIQGVKGSGKSLISHAAILELLSKDLYKKAFIFHTKSDKAINDYLFNVWSDLATEEERSSNHLLVKRFPYSRVQPINLDNHISYPYKNCLILVDKNLLDQTELDKIANYIGHGSKIIVIDYETNNFVDAIEIYLPSDYRDTLVRNFMSE